MTAHVSVLLESVIRSECSIKEYQSIFVCQWGGAFAPPCICHYIAKCCVYYYIAILMCIFDHSTVYFLTPCRLKI